MKKKKQNRNKYARQRLNSDSKPLSSKMTAFSYTQKRSDKNANVGRSLINNQDKSTKNLKFIWKRLVASGVIIILGYLIYTRVSLNDNPVILASSSNYNILVEANQSEYKSIVKSYIDSSFWHKNKITFNSNALSQKILSSNSGIESVDINLSLFSSSVKVYIEPISASVILNASNGSFLLDSQGRVLEEAAIASALKQPSNIPQINEESSQSFKVGDDALNSNDISFIQTVIYEIGKKGYTVSSMSLPPSSDELDVSLSGQSYYVKFNLESGDARKQAGTFLATINYLNQQHITPTKYIDVRVDGRSYYL